MDQRRASLLQFAQKATFNQLQKAKQQHQRYSEIRKDMRSNYEQMKAKPLDDAVRAAVENAIAQQQQISNTFHSSCVSLNRDYEKLMRRAPKRASM